MTKVFDNDYKKVVAWGTGSFFKELYKSIPYKYNYIIDNDPEKWGKNYEGIPIYSPEKLLEENSQQVLIVVFSVFFQDILEQIKSMGDYKAVIANEAFTDIEYKQALDEIELSTKSVSLRRNPNSRNAILLQGATNKETIQIAKYYAHIYKDDFIILSTWENTPEDIIEGINPYVDYIILNSLLDYNGVGNRNAQIVTTLNGIKLASELGLKKLLKTRTDMGILRKNIFKECIQLQNKYPITEENNMKLRNRIIISQLWTKKYQLYFPSDVLMFGDVIDLLLYWDIPLDERTLDSEDFVNLEEISLYEASLKGLYTETYIAINFCKKMGFYQNGKLENSLKFYKDFYIIQDNDWFDIITYKYKMKLYKLVTDEHMTHQTWIEVGQKEIKSEVNLHKTKLSKFTFK